MKREGPRLIILGGGIASLTTAFYASDERHAHLFPGGIHVYEKSGQLGGKGASVRGSSPHIIHRIEEHGLHVWFGSYDNAFALLAACHDYLESRASVALRWSTALRSVEDGFRPCSRVAVMDHDGSAWAPWTAEFPTDAHRPWHPRQDDDSVFSPSSIAMRALRLAEAFLYSALGASGVQGRPHATWLDPAILPIPFPLPGLAPVTDGLARVLMTPSAGSWELLSRALQALSRGARELRQRLDDPIRRHTGSRRIWYLVELLLAAVRGLIDHGVLHTNRLELIDGFDLREWLVLNGASEESVSCSLLKSLAYDLAFAYEAGDPERPRCSAAVGVFGLFRLLFTYRGAVMWKMNAGMGEIVFAPIYEALIKRGVQFYFGHDLTEIELRGNSVQQLAFQVQPRDRDWRGNGALPRLSIENGVLAGELPYWDKPAASSSAVERVSLDVAPQDRVVYGLPVGTLRQLLPANAPQRWHDCAAHLKTVGTVSLQLWLRAPVDRYAPWATPDITVGAYTEPFDTWADMRVLAGERAVHDGAPIGSVAYFANVIPEAVSSELCAVSRFVDRGLVGLWPRFEPGMILDQYSQSNLDDSARYTLSVPGTLEYRLSPRDDSIKNMRPVGDWTRNSINAGCIEAAVISGMLAANALLGGPLRIVGERGFEETGQ
jgi:uncharacterized protein with NAD-binding domain and iron-sulfur cluster